MELTTIGSVSRHYGISTRTLRYYEEIGLIRSLRTEGYAYRMYDRQALERLNQIVVLRKLRIPLRQVAVILETRDAREAAAVFREAIGAMDEGIEAMSTIRSILQRFLRRIGQIAGKPLPAGIFDDEFVMRLAEPLLPTKLDTKEEASMEELQKADRALAKLNDVRIVYLPPATVAASHYIGEEAENHAGAAMEKFVRDARLWEVKPDMRSYGFNHPNQVEGEDYHGYEFWVTIPDDLDVPEPLTKQRFPGGLYAAHVISMGNFHEWEWLYKWGMESPDYDLNTVDDGGERMNGLLEECLNYPNVVRDGGMAGAGDKVQLDLLLPIKPRATGA